MIDGYAARINPRALGLGLSAWLRIRPVPGDCGGSQRSCAGLPAIVECDRVTGEDCFVARAHVESVEALEAVIDEIAPIAMTNTAIIQSSPVTRRLPPILAWTATSGRPQHRSRLKSRRIHRQVGHVLHRRHRRSPQCGQVDPVQPAGRQARGAGRRPVRASPATAASARAALAPWSSPSSTPPGWRSTPPDGVETDMLQQTRRALADADVALLVFDARAGLTPMDRHFARMLRRLETPLLIGRQQMRGQCRRCRADRGP